MTPFRHRSLRQQLLIMGLTSALLPLMLLLAVVFATTSSEEDFIEGPAAVADATPRDVEDPARGFEDESSSGVPVAVPLTALALGLATALGVWWWSGRAVEPINHLTELTNRIESTSLDRRVGLSGEAQEVQDLADGFDRMLVRLSDQAGLQQRLMEDTSHELRTPLAALAVNNEIILANADPSIGDYRASAERAEALVERLQLTVDELLSAARSRSRVVQQVDNDLMIIVDRVVDRHLALNPDVVIGVAGPTELRLGIDGVSVERAVTNLVENASRFSPAGVPIDVVIDAGPPATLSVTDRGPGIPPEEHSRVFERYYTRGEERDDAAVPMGSGIGLAIVKHVADAHGGVEVRSPLEDGPGTRFTITFTGTTR
ncbi:MAG: HAMP domain-containing sensor histidine kinase [Acidimicrobiales bacterium]